MNYFVYKGNAAFEEQPGSTLVRVGRRQATIPSATASTSELRHVALDFTRPVPVPDAAPSTARAILDRLGAIARTDLLNAHLPGWSYVLRHATDPDAAMRALAGWKVSHAPSPAAADDERELVDSRFAMFSPSNGLLECLVVVLQSESASVSLQQQLRAVENTGADLYLVVDPVATVDQPARVIVTDDLESLRRLYALRLPARDGAQGLAPVGSPIRRLLFALGVALLVDRVGGIGRLRNGYTVSRDLVVENSTHAGLPRAFPAQHPERVALKPADAQIVDGLLVAASRDARLASDLRLEIVDGKAFATCEWVFKGRVRRVVESGQDLGRAATRALASAVAQSLELVGLRSFFVQVGTAEIRRGDQSTCVGVDVGTLLGTELIRLDVDAAAVLRGPDEHG
ncbi:hypothetical protein [Microbacterium aurugineum]